MRTTIQAPWGPLTYAALCAAQAPALIALREAIDAGASIPDSPYGVFERAQALTRNVEAFPPNQFGYWPGHMMTGGAIALAGGRASMTLRREGDDGVLIISCAAEDEADCSASYRRDVVLGALARLQHAGGTLTDLGRPPVALIGAAP